MRRGEPGFEALECVIAECTVRVVSLRRMPIKQLFATMLFALIVGLPTRSLAKSPEELLPELGTAYAADAKVAFGGVTLGTPSTVTAASLAADRARVVAALQVGYAPDGKTFETFSWSDIQTVLSATTESGVSPADAAKAAVVPGARVFPTIWKIGDGAVAGFAVFDVRGRLTFETLLFLPIIRVPIFEAP